MFTNKPLDNIALGLRRAARATRRYAKSFYFSSLFLPPAKRDAFYSIYAICRLSDEATDKDASLFELSNIKRSIDAVYEGQSPHNNLLLAFKKSVEDYDIPKKYFEDLVDGMYMDFVKQRYANFAELEEYCYKVAGVIGLIVLKILGSQSPEAKEYAVHIGIAMQLTNILRDIKEDYQRGRIYLPQDEMSSFGVSEADIANANLNDNFRSLMKFQIKRARTWYHNSEPGFKLIDKKRERFVAYNMKEIYSGILDSIEKNHYDVFSKRAYVSLIGKIIRSWKASRKLNHEN
ncbi:MAG: phytoene/squalene synthase family protein [Candidatus Omnitrophica bacterium]|jgi:phytoene synthase|nr:phytoene/squalene synthase family protein [Candidatus Omnitrophota bacterium]